MEVEAMEAWMWIVLIVLLLIVAAGAYAAGQRRRRQRVQDSFGPEYERVERDKGARGATRELAGREKRREKLDIRPLSEEKREHYSAQWHDMQSRFVEDPGEAVRDADALVTDVMRERGYPMDDFDQRAADVSVDHPNVVSNYRSAHAIAEKRGRDEATTEDLRQATLHYRALFEELLEPDRRAEAKSHDTNEHHVDRDRDTEYPRETRAEHH
jgi:hypothetical protein